MHGCVHGCFGDGVWCHGFMKADWRISVKDYSRSLRTAPVSARLFWVRMTRIRSASAWQDGQPWPKSRLPLAETRRTTANGTGKHNGCTLPSRRYREPGLKAKGRSDDFRKLRRACPVSFSFYGAGSILCRLGGNRVFNIRELPDDKSRSYWTVKA